MPKNRSHTVDAYQIHLMGSDYAPDLSEASALMHTFVHESVHIYQALKDKDYIGHIISDALKWGKDGAYDYTKQGSNLSYEGQAQKIADSYFGRQ